jgi:hypothetical protein
MTKVSNEEQSNNANVLLPAVLQGQIEVLEQLEYTQAYTGELGNLKQSSYVLYSDVINLLNKKRKDLKDLQNCR